jgi:hypothetical protein
MLSYEIDYHIAARKLEREGKWEEALVIWKRLNEQDHIKAVEYIIDSNERGNRYRELTKGVIQDYESHKINNRELHDLLTAAHNKVYLVK